MKTITTITIVIFFFMALAVAAWIKSEIKKQKIANFNKYEYAYWQIECLINNYVVSDINSDCIQRHLATLSKMKHKNKKKTADLVIEFCRKFKCKI